MITNKMFLTSIAALMLATPAMAATVEGAPTDLDGTGYSGYYKADTTYTGAAKYENIGVYENEVTAEADYEAILYQIAAGKYLPANTEYDNATGAGAVECPANSYCVGLSNATYSAENQGINACPDGFALSAAGASSNTECYRVCNINNMGDTFTNIAHATAVSGNDYYGNGADTCSATACEKGYHPELGLSESELSEIRHNIMVRIAMHALGMTEAEVTAQYTDAEMLAYVESEGMTWLFEGPIELIPSADAYLKSINPNADIYEPFPIHINSSAQDGLEPGEWSMDFSYGKLKGISKCTANAGGKKGMAGNPDAETAGEAKYCWCHANTLDDVAVSSAWISGYGYDSADSCAEHCAFNCADDVAIMPGLRAALFGNGSAQKICKANTITIKWDGVDQPTTVKYDGDITTPVEAKKIPGKRFKGWKFTTPTTTGD